MRLSSLLAFKKGGILLLQILLHISIPAHFITSKQNEMANKIKVLFWLRRTKTNKQGKPPILRLSYQRERVDKATGFYINPGLWNTIKQRAKGHKAPENDLNSWINTKIIDELKLRICKYYIQRQYVKKPLFIKKNISR